MLFNLLCIKMTELTAVFVGVEDGSVDIEEEDGSDDIMEECEKDPLITTSQSTIGKRNTNVLKCIKNPNFAVVQVSFVWEVVVSSNIFTKISPMEFNNSETCGAVKAPFCWWSKNDKKIIRTKKILCLWEVVTTNKYIHG